MPNNEHFAYLLSAAAILSEWSSAADEIAYQHLFDATTTVAPQPAPAAPVEEDDV